MNEKTKVLAMLRSVLTVLNSIAENADLPAIAFLIGMAELEATQAETNAKREAITKR